MGKPYAPRICRKNKNNGETRVLVGQFKYRLLSILLESNLLKPLQRYPHLIALLVRDMVPVIPGRKVPRRKKRRKINPYTITGRRCLQRRPACLLRSRKDPRGKSPDFRRDGLLRFASPRTKPPRRCPSLRPQWRPWGIFFRILRGVIDVGVFTDLTRTHARRNP